MKIIKTILLTLLGVGQATLQAYTKDKYYQSVKFTDGKWLINDEFKSITIYSIDGDFSFNPPDYVEKTWSFSGHWQR